MVVGAAVDTSKSNRTLVPLAIGIAVLVCHIVAIPITGTSINPTRSFASAAAAQWSEAETCHHVWKHHWIFWIAPIMGAICGLVLYETLVSETVTSATLTKMYRRSSISLKRDSDAHGHRHDSVASMQQDMGGSPEKMHDGVHYAVAPDVAHDDAHDVMAQDGVAPDALDGVAHDSVAPVELVNREEVKERENHHLHGDKEAI